jgi:hypothetical protein
MNGMSHGRTESTSSISRAPPPPPPQPPQQTAPRRDMYRVLYEFNGTAGTTELSIVKDELVEVLQKGDTGELNRALIPVILTHFRLVADKEVRRQSRIRTDCLSQRRRNQPRPSSAPTPRCSTHCEWCSQAHGKSEANTPTTPNQTTSRKETGAGASPKR